MIILWQGKVSINNVTSEVQPTYYKQMFGAAVILNAHNCIHNKRLQLQEKNSKVIHPFCAIAAWDLLMMIDPHAILPSNSCWQFLLKMKKHKMCPQMRACSHASKLTYVMTNVKILWRMRFTGHYISETTSPWNKVRIDDFPAVSHYDPNSKIKLLCSATKFHCPGTRTNCNSKTFTKVLISLKICFSTLQELAFQLRFSTKGNVVCKTIIFQDLESNQWNLVASLRPIPCAQC